MMLPPTRDDHQNDEDADMEFPITKLFRLHETRVASSYAKYANKEPFTAVNKLDTTWWEDDEMMTFGTRTRNLAPSTMPSSTGYRVDQLFVI